MSRWLFRFWVVALALCVVSLGIQAQAAEDPVLSKLKELQERLERLERAEKAPPAQEGRTVEVEDLRRQLDVLAEELEKVRSGEQQTLDLSPEQARALGLGPSAASIYRRKQGVSLAGYGEMLYQNFDSEDQQGRAVGSVSRLDFLRAIFYAGYRFNDKFLFNSEIEIEHSATDKSGEVSVEFAYVDYIASPRFAVRGGMLLVPMGLVNEFHEPNVFIGARRSETESAIIPSTWRENGFGFHGSSGKFSYRAYLINGLDASGFSSSGLRGGRQKGSQAKADDFAFVGRLDVTPTPGLFLGGSFYRGGSGQGIRIAAGRELEVTTTIVEIHGQLQWRGVDVRGLYAAASLDDVAELNQARGLQGASSIGQEQRGGYLQFGYNLLNEFYDSVQLTPYYRFENVDTQHEVPSGFQSDPARDRTFHTFGFEYKPIPHVVLKFDYQHITNQARSGIGQFNAALGYSF